MRPSAALSWFLALMVASSFAHPTTSATNSTQALQAPRCQNLPVDTRDIASTNYVHLVKSVKLSTGTTYRYIISRPWTPDMPWILFIHGFPSTSFDWRNQIEYFSSRGYGVVAPDLLGYGGTDNPAELGRFALKSQVEELDQLLDCEGVGHVFAAGHDFGSVVLSRVVTYMTERLTGVIFIGVGYDAPPMSFNQAGVELANNATLQALGYPAFGYWYFMNDDDVESIMDANMDSAFTLTYTDTPEYMKEHFSPVGKYREWLLDGRTAPWTKYLEPDAKSIFKRITMSNGGFDGPVKSYKSLLRDVNLADEEVLPVGFKIEAPVLLLTASLDPVGLAAAQVDNTEPYANSIRIKSIEAGHFLQVEKPQDVSYEIDVFINDVLAGAFP